MKTTPAIRPSLNKITATLGSFAILSSFSLNLLACGPYVSFDDDFVAHEWGTFTSIQGGDGVLLDWNGIATSDLPLFVYDWESAGLRPLMTYADKGSMFALQRMETPVIYFYSDRSLSVDVTVRFPRGRMTEWFPRASKIGPSMTTNAGNDATYESIIRWDNVEVIPPHLDRTLAGELPGSKAPSHYFAARHPDAAFARIVTPGPTNNTVEVEKFLFYRGVGNFPTPLKVTMDGQGAVTVTNSGHEPLKNLFAVANDGRRATVVPLGNLDVGEARSTRLDQTSDSLTPSNAVESLRMQMAGALIAEGLYRAEAEAMVNTWRDAWFEDQGVRILYILPRKWTDTTLPLTMTPAPKELVRVMVGRAEIITPAMAQQVARSVEGFRQSDPDVRMTAVSEFKAMKLGRFAPVALRVAGARRGDAKFLEDGTRLLEAATKSEAALERRSAGVPPASSLGVPPKDSSGGETPPNSQPGTAALPARRLAATGG